MNVKSMTTYPILDAQLGVILSCGTAPGTTAWNLPSVISFDKTISAERLFRAVCDICRCRKELHVQFVRTEEGTIRQYTDNDMDIPVRHTKMSDSQAQEYMRRGFVRPFQLFSRQPLCRFEIVETERRVLLLSDLHHSIADGFTVAGRLIGSDLPEAYGGNPLGEPRMTLFDWARREQEEMKTPAYARAKEYFHALFAEAEVTQLAAAGAQVGGEEIVEKVSLRMGEVDEWCARHRVSAYHFLMAAFCLTLSKLSHQRKVVFCTLNHGRYDKKLAEAYGMFVNTVPFIAEINPRATIDELMSQVRKRLVDHYRHRSYPFTHFCSDTGLVPTITFGFQSNGILEQTIIDGKRYEGAQLLRPDSRSDLSVMVYSSGDEYEIRVEACNALYGKADLRRFGQAMAHCVSHLMQYENQPIGEVDLIDDAQKTAILNLSAGERHDYSSLPTIVGMFVRQADATPHAVAVDDAAERLTYRELELQTRSLAHALVAEGVRSGTFVGVDTTPCVGFLVAALAVMRAGGAYVPIDAQLPPKRRQHILEDAGIRLVVDAAYVRKHASTDEASQPIDLSSPSHKAYMIYTSGTSGMPKGVVVGHAALSNLIGFCVRRWPLTERSRIACHSTFAFDASVEDLFPVLSVGGCVVIVPEETRTDFDALAAFMQKYQITGGCLATRFGVAMAETHLLDVDYICLGGERLISNPRVRGRVYNTYGPTEFTVDATYFELVKDRRYDPVPIGRPLDNCHAFVVDSYGCLLPQGAVGELWLAGPQVAEGYWNAPALTAEKFTRCSFCDGTVFHTGDLARWNKEGLLEYVGRVDHLVKIDGVRISLDEIEACLLDIPKIDEAAVVAREMNGTPQIQAFFTSKEQVAVSEIKEILSESLPPQMIPGQLVRLEKMPTTASGKIDRLGLRVETAARVVAPSSASEWVLCQLMANVLGAERVGPDDDFFACGGTSLSAMQMVAEARKCGIALAYENIFAHPTPRALSACVDNDGHASLYDTGHYDYRSINQLLACDARRGGRSFPDGGTLLLTGATGFLGAHVLARFLGAKSWRVVAVVRGHDLQEAWQRLRDRWAFYFDPQPLDTERLDVVCGDLAQPSSLAELDKISFDVVVNCAADVRYFAHDDHIMRVNAQWMEHLSRLCLEKGARLVQASTLSIAGVDASGSMSAMSSTVLDRHQRFVDQYSYSKFLAERTILQRMAHDGLQASIIRMGYLAPRAGDGKISANADANMLFSLLKAMKDVGACPESARRLEVVWAPVDVVAEGVFHHTVVCPSRPVVDVEGMERCSLKHLADRFAGKKLPLITDEDFRQQAARQLKTGLWMLLFPYLSKDA